MKVAYGKPKDITKKRKQFIALIDEITREYDAQGMRITVRQAYYQLVARGILPNGEKSYKKVSAAIKDGRLAGLLDWDFFEDRTRNVHENTHWDNPQQIIKAAAQQYKIDTRINQPFYIEAWVEKDALIGVIGERCSQLDVPCFACKGFSSITILHEAAERFRDKRNPVILYAGDHDPTGLTITRNINKRLKDFGVDVQVRRIGITLDQIKELNLPSFPVKEKDNNLPAYIAATGLTQAWELDALPPEMLVNLFENAINELTDFDVLEKMRKIESEHKTYFQRILKK